MQQLVAFLLGLIIAVASAPLWIPYFKKLKFGQYIREDGPSAHLAKQGTPTFGGAIFLTAFVLGMAVLSYHTKEIYSILFLTLAFGLVGFIDDYIIVVKKNNAGLKPLYKLLGLFIIALSAYLFFYKEHISHFYADWFQISGVLWVVFFIFVALATSNATNLTDGIDGLCASVTLVISLFFSALCYHRGLADLLSLNLLFSGALVGYLIFNWHPAKVFMGDMGSLAIGGYVLANAVILNIEWFIPIFGFIYLAETLSVILQVASFKLTGKRIFKMSPIHHHFEAIGWKETQIVFRFSALTLILSLVTYFLVS